MLDSTWMESFIDLQRSFDALHQTKEDSQEQDDHRYPERVPLDPIASIIPPL